MLKKITLAAIVALGTATLAGMSAPPAAADNIRSLRVFEHGGFSYASNQFRHDRRGDRVSRHGPRWKFLKRVRNGRVVCFAKPSRRGAYRFDRRWHRSYRAHGRRLGYRAVRRLVRHGRRHAMRCFRNV
jgi:hypothetical protein